MDGQGTVATFWSPTGVAADASEIVYVADVNNHRIRVVSISRLVSTLAGSGVPAWADGAGAAASFYRPYGIATAHTSGIVYVADSSNHRIRKLTLTGVTTTFAGNGTATFFDGQGTLASFNDPRGLCVDSMGVVYVADMFNNRIRKITPLGAVTTLAGTEISNGVGTTASFFNFPRGVAVDDSGNVFVGDTGNHVIRHIANGTVLSCGSGSAEHADGTCATASFSSPRQLAIAADGSLLVADSDNNRIRMITPLGQVTTVAGGQDSFFADGYGTSSRFSSPLGIAVSPFGTVYVADYFNNRIRALTCMPCPSGSECTSGYPQPCSSGSLCPFASFYPEPCPAGFFCPDATYTTLCPAGSYCPVGSASPLPCSPGSYTSVSGRSACLLCAPGQLAPKAGSTLCDEFCPTGSYRSRPGGTNASSCPPCPPGSYGESEGASACTPCPIGTYLSAPGATSAASCLACGMGTSTLAQGSTSSAQCIPTAVTCPPGTQPTSSSPIYNSATGCITLTCPPPLALLQNASFCASCPTGTVGSPLGSSAGCTPCAMPALCTGLTSMPHYNFLALQQLQTPLPQGARNLALAPNAAAAHLLSACPMATFTQPTPPAPPTSLFVVYAQLLAGGGLLGLICAVSFAFTLLRPQYLDFLKRFDLFTDKHEPPPSAEYTPLPYPTRLGGMCSIWAVILLLVYGAFLVQQYFSAANILTQQSLAVLLSTLWTPPLSWSEAALPWAGGAPPLTGLQLRLLLSGPAGACAAPASWSGQGQGAGGWTLASTPLCTTNSSDALPVSQHTFSCPSCVFGAASALTASFSFSCQAAVLEAISVPSFPVGTTSSFSADVNVTALARPQALLASLTWTLNLVSTQLLDSSSSALPWASSASRPSPLGYLLASQQLDTTTTPLAAVEGSAGFPALQPALHSVNITVLLPLQPLVSVTQLTPISNFASLLAQLVGISGLLGFFHAAFGVAEKAAKRFAPGLVEKRGGQEDGGDASGGVGGVASGIGGGKEVGKGDGKVEGSEDAGGGALRHRVAHLREVQEEVGAPTGLGAAAFPASALALQLAPPAAAPPKEELPPLEDGLGLWQGRSSKVLPLQPGSGEAQPQQPLARD